MATLKVFISSTCYDLGVVRSKLQEFLRSLGFEPVLSEYSDVLYDPRTHTHTSCVDEVSNCDVVVLLIGSRFGGKAVPEALSRIDLSKLKKLSSSNWSLEEDRHLSITQIEVLKAIELQHPLFVFVEERVMHDHLVYEKNKHKNILSEISFPSVERPESAPYIFEFINFLRLRNAGNSVTTFSRIDDIEAHLRKQWSALFQRLLREDRTRAAEGTRAREIQSQLDELKAAILSSIQEPEAREVARSVIRFRRLVEFVLALDIPKAVILDDQVTWAQLMDLGQVSKVARFEGRTHPRRAFLIMRDGSTAILRTTFQFLLNLIDDVSHSPTLPRQTREAVLEAWTETNSVGRDLLLLRQGRTVEDILVQNGTAAAVTFYNAHDLQTPIESISLLPSKSAGDDDDDEGPF